MLVPSGRILVIAFAIIALTAVRTTAQLTIPSRFTWFGGEPFNSSGNSGYAPIYEVLGVPSTTTWPGSLHSSCSFYRNATKSGQRELWLWGGSVSGITVPHGGTSNAMWRYDVSTNMWTWIHGPATLRVDDVHGGNFGTQGQFAPQNVPPARYSPGCWYDPDADELWMFGGAVLGGPSIKPANDLWRYSVSLNMWAWMSGSPNLDDPGVKGTIGVPCNTCYPRGFYEIVPWFTCSPKRLWFLSSQWLGADNRAEFWSYTIATREWTLVDDRAKAIGSIEKQESSSLYPGSYSGAFGFVVGNAEFWMFGGEDVSRTRFADIWRYRLSTGMWSQMRMSASYSYGTMGVASSTNMPPARRSPIGGYNPILRQLVIFSGYSVGSDVWTFDLDSNFWTWQYGTPEQKEASTSVVFGVTDPTNLPSCRSNAASWYDSEVQQLWFFGGGSPTKYSYMADLWVFHYGTYSYTPIVQSPSQVSTTPPTSAPTQSNVATPTLPPAASAPPASPTPSAVPQSSTPSGTGDLMKLTLIIHVQLNGVAAGQFDPQDIVFLVNTVKSVIGELVGMNASSIEVTIELAPPKATLTAQMMIPLNSFANVTSTSGSVKLVTAINSKSNGKFSVLNIGSSSTTSTAASTFAVSPLQFLLVLVLGYLYVIKRLA